MTVSYVANSKVDTVDRDYYTTASFTMPTVADGDVGFVMLFCRSALTAPSGWEQVAERKCDDFNQWHYVYKKTLSASESGGTVTFTQASAARFQLCFAAFRSTGTLAVIASATHWTVGDQNNSCIYPPVMTATADGQMALLSSSNVYADTTYRVPLAVYNITGSERAGLRLGARYWALNSGQSTSGSFTNESGTRSYTAISLLLATQAPGGAEATFEGGSDAAFAALVAKRGALTSAGSAAMAFAPREKAALSSLGVSSFSVLAKALAATTIEMGGVSTVNSVGMTARLAALLSAGEAGVLGDGRAGIITTMTGAGAGALIAAADEILRFAPQRIFTSAYTSNGTTITFPISALVDVTAEEADALTGDWREILQGLLRGVDAYLESLNRVERIFPSTFRTFILEDFNADHKELGRGLKRQIATKINITYNLCPSVLADEPQTE